MESRRNRYRHYWYPIIIDMMYQYPRIKTSTKPKEMEFVKALEDSIEEIEQFEDAELRKQAFEMLYFNRTHKTVGVSMKLNISRQTLERWKTDFVNSIAKKFGY